MMGWQWHQLNHIQAICTLLQKTTTPAPHQSDFYGPDALPDTQPTASKHRRPVHLTQTTYNVQKLLQWYLQIQIKLGYHSILATCVINVYFITLYSLQTVQPVFNNSTRLIRSISNGHFHCNLLFSFRLARLFRGKVWHICRPTWLHICRLTWLQFCRQIGLHICRLIRLNSNLMKRKSSYQYET